MADQLLELLNFEDVDENSRPPSSPTYSPPPSPIDFARSPLRPEEPLRPEAPLRPEEPAGKRPPVKSSSNGETPANKTPVGKSSVVATKELDKSLYIIQPSLEDRPKRVRKTKTDLFAVLHPTLSWNEYSKKKNHEYHKELLREWAIHDKVFNDAVAEWEKAYPVKAESFNSSKIRKTSSEKTETTCASSSATNGSTATMDLQTAAELCRAVRAICEDKNRVMEIVEKIEKRIRRSLDDDHI